MNSALNINRVVWKGLRIVSHCFSETVENKQVLDDCKKPKQIIGFLLKRDLQKSGWERVRKWNTCHSAFSFWKIQGQVIQYTMSKCLEDTKEDANPIKPKSYIFMK